MNLSCCVLKNKYSTKFKESTYLYHAEISGKCNLKKKTEYEFWGRMVKQVQHIVFLRLKNIVFIQVLDYI